MTNKKTKDPNSTGIKILIICGLVAVALIIGCVFFPDEIFGLFLK